MTLLSRERSLARGYEVEILDERAMMCPREDVRFDVPSVPLSAIRRKSKEMVLGETHAKVTNMAKHTFDILSLDHLSYEDLIAVQDRIAVLVEARREEKRQKGEVRSRPCSICGFLTEPNHDKRSHRQQEHQVPFSDDDLTAMGVVRVRLGDMSSLES